MKRLHVQNQEVLMCQVRLLLSQATRCERTRGELERADAFGAMAANKLSIVVAMNDQPRRKK